MATNAEIVKLINAAHYAVASGTNTYTAATSLPAPPLTSYVAGQWYVIRFTNANTGASTINIDGLGAKAIQKAVARPLVASDIAAGALVMMSYNGTAFQVIGGIDLNFFISQTINASIANLIQTII